MLSLAVCCGRLLGRSWPRGGDSYGIGNKPVGRGDWRGEL